MTSPVVKFDSNSKEFDIYVIQAGERICFFGSFQILCISGNVTLNNFRLPNFSVESDNFMKVTAPQRMGIPAILQVHKSVKEFNFNRVKFRLKEITSSYEEIMKTINGDNLAVIVVKKSLSIVDEIVSSLIPNFLIHSSKQKLMLVPARYDSARLDLYIYPSECEKMLEHRISNLNANRKLGRKLSVLPIGNKGVGKSNLVRNLINRFLNSGSDCVYILDVDIGQCEFTPSGCMSLTKVTSPIFDKPYNHQKAKFENSYFYGDITVNNFALYKDIFERLWNTFLEISSPGDICVINSMGWIEDIGAEIICEIINIAKPNLIIELMRSISDRMFLFPKNLPSDPMQIMANDVPAAFGSNEKKLSAGLIRDLSVIGYFTKLLTRSMISSIFNIVPLKMSFSNVKIGLPIDIFVDDRCVLAAINNQMLAICQDSTEIKSHRICESEEFPELCMIDAKSPALKCYGFAMVRAVSIEKRELYLLTPVDLQNFEESPIFVRGIRIDLPTHLMSANLYNVSPYLLENDEQKSRDSANLIADLFNAPVNLTGHKRSRKAI